VSGQDILAATVQNGLEGVIAKRRASPYRPGRRSPDWVKVKSFRTQEVVIGAWTEGHGDRQRSLGALLLGIPEGDGMRYVGKVGTGFGAKARSALLEDLRPLATAESPFVSVVPAGCDRRPGGDSVRTRRPGRLSRNEAARVR
jgi:bifunctional non-homologous end joining protein LigD